MSVSVEFRPFSDCRLNEDGHFVLESQGGTKYRLPQLIIAPGWDNIPHVYAIDARVSGLVESANTRLLEAYRIPGGALKKRPIRLEREECTPPPPGLIDLDDELRDKPFELTVTVRYYNSGEGGAPVTEDPLQASAKAIMLVSPNRATRMLDEPVTIDVSPKHKLLHESPLQVLLTLTTTGPDSQPPTTALADGREGLDPTLQDIIKVALTEKPRLLEQRGPQGERYWEKNIQIEMDSAIRERLQADYSTPSQCIGLVSQYGDAAVEHALEIDFRPLKDVFTDWLCIDFGTSNSAVALFDQTKRPRSDGLPKEQLEYLSRAMNEWLSADPKDVFKASRSVAEEWCTILQQISEELTGGGPAALQRLFRTGDENEKLNIIRRIEKQDMSSETRRAVFSRLNRILQQTFWTPALSQETIFPVKLDQATGTEIPSEAEVRALNPLQVKVGTQARANRRQAEAREHDTQGRFHISCKQYLGTDQEFRVNLDGEASGSVKYDALIREIWRYLISLVDSYRERNKQQHDQGRIQKAIITYPTVSPPGVRRRIRKLAQEIGINSVEISYDEAVAAAVFYLMRDLGGEIDFGLDAFVSRSRPLDDKGIYWTQNVLVFDIGGGTTDIALIRLMLEDQTGPQMHGKESNHSAGGRYFKITPEILGSSGHMQLGGDLITLRTFLGIKALLAEEILERFPQSSRALDMVKSFPPALRGDDGKYARGKLIELICEGLSAKIEQRSSDHEEALSYVEQLVPTRWEGKSGEERSRARNCFNLLWALAEKAKEQFGKEKLTKFDWTDPVDAQSPPFEPSSADLEDILKGLVACETQSQEGQRIRLSMSQAMFEDLARPVIREAASIARGLLASRLPTRPSGKGATTYEQLDWLILSGKTCHLSLVDKELRRELEDAKVFCWNPDKVTFDPKYSKLAASIGACWAEHLRRHVQHPEGVHGLLSEGSNLLHFDVKNLFFFLPCLFKRRGIARRDDLLFNAHDKLRKLDDEEVGKARTSWRYAVLQTTIHRFDFEKQDLGHKWCDCDFSEQVKAWGMSDEEWRREIQYQVEVDQTLNMRLFFCRGQPHFCFEPSEFNVVIPGVVAVNGEQKQVLTCDIVVGLNSGGNANSCHPIFKAGAPFNRFVHRRKEESERIAVMVSEPLPAFYINDSHIVHYCAGAADSGEWTKAGIIKKPGKPSDYEQFYYATLDVEGTLTFHAGEVPYWTSANPEVLRDDKECGRVYVVEPVSKRPTPADDRNPFCGRH